MDARFPKWLRTTIDKLDFLGLPNLAPFICALAALAFVARMTGTVPLERFMFDPILIREGEWWRLFAFPVSDGLTNPLLFALYVLYIYFIVNAVEEHWGAGPTTIFVLLSYVCAMVASFITLAPSNLWYYVLLNVSLAFGTLFPNFEILLYFILPVKAKWLSLLSALYLLYQMVFGGWDTRIFLLICLAPYFLFFGPLLVNSVRDYYRLSKHKKRFDTDAWR